MPQIELATQRQSDTNIVRIAGVVDSNNFQVLAELLNRLLKTCHLSGTPPQVILDCSQINYIGSIEFSELLDFAHLARSHGGDIKCAQMPPTIELIGNLLSNGDPMECHPDVDTALTAFHSAPLVA